MAAGAGDGAGDNLGDAVGFRCERVPASPCHREAWIRGFPGRRCHLPGGADRRWRAAGQWTGQCVHHGFARDVLARGGGARPKRDL